MVDGRFAGAAMHIGIISNCTDRSLDAGTQARLAEEAGFESITFGEHSGIPLTADEGAFAAELERARAAHAEFAGTA